MGTASASGAAATVERPRALETPAFALVDPSGRPERISETFSRLIGAASLAEAPLARAVARVLDGAADRAPVEMTAVGLRGALVVEAVLGADGERRALVGGSVTWSEDTEPAATFVPFVEDSPAIVWIKDLEGHYLHVNARYSLQMGIDAGQIRGRTDAELSPREFVDGPRPPRPDGAKPEPLELEYTVPAFEGRPAMAALRFPIRNGAGQPVAVCGVATATGEARVAHAECVRLLELDRWNRDGAEEIRARLLDDWQLREPRVTRRRLTPPPPVDGPVPDGTSATAGAAAASAAEVERLTEELHAAQTEVERHQAEVERHRAEVGRARAESDRARAEVERISGELTRAGEEIERVTGELDRVRGDARRDLADVQATLREREAKLTEALAAAADRAGALERELAAERVAAADRDAANVAEAGNLAAEIGKVQAELEQSVERADAAESTIRQLEHAQAELSGELEQARSALARELDRARRAAGDEHAQIVHELQEARAELDRERRLLAEARAESDRHRLAVEETRATVDRQRDALDSARAAADRQADALALARTDWESEHRAMVESHEGAAAARAELDQAVARIAELEASIARASAKNEEDARHSAARLRELERELVARAPVEAPAPVEVVAPAIHEVTVPITSEVADPAAVASPTWDHVAQLALTKALTAGSSWRSVLKEAIKVIGRHGGWEAVIAWGPDESGARLACHAMWSRQPDELAGFETATWQLTHRPGTGAIGTAAQAGEPAWIASLQGVSDRHLCAVAAAGMNAVLVLPVHREGELVGVLELCASSAGPLDPAVEASLSAAAAQLAHLEHLLRLSSRPKWGVGRM